MKEYQEIKDGSKLFSYPFEELLKGLDAIEKELEKNFKEQLTSLVEITKLKILASPLSEEDKAKCLEKLKEV